jgi:hypothetical protein
MGTTGSVDGASRLVIKGRFQQKQVENVLRRYIGTFPLALLSQWISSDQNLYSRVRDMQNLQIARHSSHQGEPYLLHVLRVVRK